MSLQERELSGDANILQRELESMADEVAGLRLDTRVKFAELRLECELLKRILAEVAPDYQARYSRLRSDLLAETDPEEL